MLSWSILSSHLQMPALLCWIKFTLLLLPVNDFPPHCLPCWMKSNTEIIKQLQFISPSTQISGTLDVRVWTTGGKKVQPEHPDGLKAYFHPICLFHPHSLIDCTVHTCCLCSMLVPVLTPVLFLILSDVVVVLLPQQLIMSLCWQHNGKRGNWGNLCSSPLTCFPEHVSPSPLCSASHPATCLLTYTIVWRLSPGSLIKKKKKNLWIVWVPEWEQKQFLYLKDTRKPFRFGRSTAWIKPFLCSVLKPRSSWNIEDGWKWRRRAPLLFFFF